MYVCVCTRVSVCVSAFVRACVRACVHACIYVCVIVRVCMHVCVFQNMLQAKVDELIKSVQMAESIVQQNGEARIKEVCNYKLYRNILYSRFR